MFMRKLMIYLFLFVWVTVVSAQNMDTGQSEKFSTFNSQLSTQEFGLVLSGGGALGLAHIGAIKALEEYGIEPRYVAGSSMGAIIGVMYAAGYSADEIMAIVKEKRLYKVGHLMTWQSAHWNQGMSTQKTLYKELREFVSHNSFDSLERRFMVCVTNVENGQPEYRYMGSNLIEFVAASACVQPNVNKRKVFGLLSHFIFKFSKFCTTYCWWANIHHIVNSIFLHIVS